MKLPTKNRVRAILSSVVLMGTLAVLASKPLMGVMQVISSPLEKEMIQIDLERMYPINWILLTIILAMEILIFLFLAPSMLSITKSCSGYVSKKYSLKASNGTVHHDRYFVKVCNMTFWLNHTDYQSISLGEKITFHYPVKFFLFGKVKEPYFFTKDE